MVLKLINLWQSKEEREEKYWLARSFGYNSNWSRRMRDWRISKIERIGPLNPDVCKKNMTCELAHSGKP